MKVTLAVVLLLLSPTLCGAQDGRGRRNAPAEEYAARLVRLVEGLQKNPWQGWKAGTVVLVRYLDDADAVNGATTGATVDVQPDLVYKVLEADKLFIRTQELKGKSVRQDFLVKDQRGLDAARVRLKDEVATAANLWLDGFTLSGLLSELRVEEFPGGTRTTKEWSLAAHPSILLRQEVNGFGWRVTSAKVSKKIGDREFECVEIKKAMRLYPDGRPMEVSTTQYLSPDVPGHLVEEVEEFLKFGDKDTPTQHTVVHRKVVELKIQ